MKTKGALLWEPGTNSGWSVEEIEVDPPRRAEVSVRLAASGICHSDQHLDDGVIPLDWAPVLGGHEGAGVVVDVGPDVDGISKGDHVVLMFMPACGRCRMCVSGLSNMCAMGAGTLAGIAPDGTKRVRARGQGVGCMCYLGTFSPYATVPVDSVVKINKDIPLEKAALLGCGVPTGWGSSVYAADMQVGDTVVVIGAGGVGINAVQGAKHKGARHIIAVDPVRFKQDQALKLGATHAVGSLDTAAELVGQLTEGEGADAAIMAVGVAHGLMNPAQELLRRGGVLVMASVAPVTQSTVEFDLFGFAMAGKRLQGSLYGTPKARNDIPLLASMYLDGNLNLDELVTKTYALEDINSAFEDLREGRNVRGVIVFD